MDGYGQCCLGHGASPKSEVEAHLPVAFAVEDHNTVMYCKAKEIALLKN